MAGKKNIKNSAKNYIVKAIKQLINASQERGVLLFKIAKFINKKLDKRKFSNKM